jgi:beta-fructofuranosidase
MQLLATLNADSTITKHPANPLIGAIPGCSAHVRDPKVWTRDGAHWMVLGAQTQDLHGTALLLRSPDLIEWQYLGQVAGGAGDPFGYMWECPDLVRLDDRDVLVISPQLDHGKNAGRDRWQDVSMYAVGNLDVDAPAFTRHADFAQVDAGPDFYAPQTLTDETGRTIMIGWMGMPDHDGQPALAEKHPTVANGWVHCLTVPRALSLDGDQLVQWPVAELTTLHGAAVTHAGLTIEPGASPVVLDGVGGPALDLDLAAEVSPGASVQVRLCEGSGRPVVVTLNPTTGTATLDRTLLGTGEGGVATGSFRASSQVHARILLDHSSIEVFVDGGRLAMTARIYPNAADTAVSIGTLGGPARVNLTSHPMSRG